MDVDSGIGEFFPNGSSFPSLGETFCSRGGRAPLSSVGLANEFLLATPLEPEISLVWSSVAYPVFLGS